VLKAGIALGVNVLVTVAVTAVVMMVVAAQTVI